MARSTHVTVSSLQSDILGVLTVKGSLPEKVIRGHFPAIRPQALKRHLSALIALKRLRCVQAGHWGRRYAVNHQQGVVPAGPDFATAIAKPKKPKPVSAETGQTWWAGCSDADFTQRARARATMMGWND